MSKKLSFLSLLLPGFVIKGFFVNYLIGFLIRFFVGIDVRPERIEFSFEKLKLSNTVIRDHFGRKLALIKDAEVGLDIFGPKPISYIKAKGAEVTIEIDLKRKYINWVKPFNKGNDYSEGGTFYIPPLGEIHLQEGNVTFIDSSYREKIVRYVKNIEARIVFDSNNQEIKVEAKGGDEAGMVSCSVLAGDGYQGVVLDVSNAIIDKPITQYTKAENILTLFSGRADLHLEVVDEKVTNGRVIFRDVLASSKYLKNHTFTSTGEVDIKGSLVNGKVKANLRDSSADVDFQVNLNNFWLSLKAETESISLPLLLNNLLPLSKFRFESEGYVKGSVEAAINVRDKNAELRVQADSRNAKVFGDELKNADIYISMDTRGKLENLEMSALFDEPALNVKLIKSFSGYNFTMRGKTNATFLRMVKINFLPSVECVVNCNIDFDRELKEFKGSAEAELIDAYLGDDRIKADFVYASQMMNFTLMNQALKFSFFRDASRYSLDGKFTKLSKITYRDIEFNAEGSFKASGKYGNLNSLENTVANLDFSNIRLAQCAVEPFKLRLKGSKGSVKSAPFDLSLKMNKNEFLISDVKMESIIDEGLFSFYITGTSVDLDFGKNIRHHFQLPVLNFVISEAGVRLRKFSTDKFRLEGIIPFNGDPSLRFNSGRLEISKYFAIENLSVNLQNRKLAFSDGFLTINEVKFPIDGSAHYDEEKVYVDSITVGKSSFAGSIAKEYDLTVNLAVDDVVARVLWNAPIMLNIVGELSIFGKLIDPIVRGELFVTSSLLPKANFSVGYHNFKLSLSNLILYEGNAGVAPEFSSVVNFKEDTVDFKLKGERLNLSGIILDSGMANIEFNMHGGLDDLEYSLWCECVNLSTLFTKADRLSLKAKGDLRGLELSEFYIASKGEMLKLEGQLSYDPFGYRFGLFSENLNLSNFLQENEYIDDISGHVNVNLELSQKDNARRLEGHIYCHGLSSTLELSKYLKKLNTEFEFSNGKALFEFNDDELDLDFISNLNGGSMRLAAHYNYTEKTLNAEAITHSCIVSLPGYFNLSVDSKWGVENGEIRGQVDVVAGDIVDIPDKSFLESSSGAKGYFSLKALSLKARDLRVKLGTLFNLEKVELNLVADVHVLQEENLYKIEGYAFSESGSIEFSKYRFDLDDMRLTFKEGRLYPHLSLSASSAVLGRLIFLGLEGDVNSKEVKIVDNLDTFDDDAFYIALWSDYQDDNNKLELGDILYLLSVGGEGSVLEKGGDMLSQQLGKSLILNPISRNIKNFFGLYQFKVSSPFFDLSNWIEGNYMNPLAGMKIEFSTNIYKNSVFFGVETIISHEGDKIDRLDINFFSLNRWIFYFSFDNPFDNILFKGLGISKRTSFGRHDIEIGISDLESLFDRRELLEGLAGVKFNFELNLRF